MNWTCLGATCSGCSACDPLVQCDPNDARFGRTTKNITPRKNAVARVEPFHVKVPKVGVVIGSSPEQVSGAVRASIESRGYGASDVGGRWVLYRGSERVGHLSYNGRIALSRMPQVSR